MHNPTAHSLPARVGIPPPILVGQRLELWTPYYTYICTDRRGQNIHRQTNPTRPRTTKGNDATAKALDHFMNYCATHPDAVT
eukprot:scaffold65099_cov68-Attheya_sp.AAC.1